jgi:hypothetical protein
MLNNLKSKWYGLIGAATALTLSSRAYADANPFPTISGGDAGADVVQTAGGHMESAMKYLTIGLGGMLILVCLGVIVHRMREDSREKDHGNLIMTYVMCALGMTIGFVLIGIGWTAFSATITG